ncbi:MAG: Gfo/Idh/MocA family oxidoreductase [Candidatus Solibacter usitatus]|nr:Gfo/Idh/MocA family oxidoreductase [Candidatus Solibacter usitatus]
MNRRFFLLTSAAAARPLQTHALRGGIIGSGGRGRYLTAQFKELGVEMGAVCDVYEPNLAAGLKAASSGARPYGNYQRLLEDKSIQAVVVATPDHWHARMVIDAVEAGKDVYVEKPMAHTIAEGFRVIEAVRRTRRVVQVGMQRRSFPLFQEGKRIVESGALGDVRLVNAWWLNHQQGLRQATLQGKLDWTQWLGTAPRREMDTTRFFNWYYFWDYSGGLMIGQAAHVVDAIHWFMNSTYPRAVTCAGGNSHLAGAEVPETTSMLIEYPEDYLAVFTVGYKAMRYAAMNDQMKQYHGSKARLDMSREGYALYPESTQAVPMQPSLSKSQPGSFESATRAHIRNFMESIAARRDPNATVEMGQHTNVVLCMAMEALRSGRRMKWNPARRDMEAD